MQKYDAIENGIANKDLKALREAVGSICYTCRDFSDGEFDSVIRYVESKGIKIKDDSLIGNPIISSQNNSFTDKDFAKAVYELKKNFCDERIKDVKTIGSKLYGTRFMQKVDTVSKKEQRSTNNIDYVTSPNYISHQQKSNIVPLVIVVLALIVVIASVVYLVKK